MAPRTEWMLLSAHPDDDVIGAAWILLSGEPLVVAQLTDGVPVDRRWWSAAASSGDGGYRAQRRSESENALAVAGLPSSALHRLGGRDLAAIDEAPRLVRALAALLEQVRPARLCTHAYEGGHPDHDTAALVGRAAVSLASVAPELWEMTSCHLGTGGVPAPAPGRFRSADKPEELRVLSPTKQEAKLRMFAAHRSQAPVLRRYSIDVERHRPAPRYDFTRPPHPGELEYERQGWGDGKTWRRKTAEALARLELAEDGCRRIQLAPGALRAVDGAAVVPMLPPGAAMDLLPERVLVVDDERNIRSMLRVCLEQAGCEVREASSAEAALAALASGPVDLAFVDLRLGTGSGLDLLPALLGEDPDLDVVVITAYASIDTAMEAVRRGARDYVAKPFTPAQIRAVLERLRERRGLRARVESLEDRLAGVDPDALLETRSAAMQAALSLLRRAAASDAAVLLRGENGTGKSVLARALHRVSGRAEKPFVTVSAPTLSDQLLVSELFGHARGAFTGAVRDAPGKVEAAEGGTLFLDEIGELGPATQAQLLRFLQEKAFERVGETRTRHADVRIVSATNRELEEDVRAGRFREDLLYRLNVVEIRVPPLRERREDILPMARRMLRQLAASLHRPGLDLAAETVPVLESYPWPGNVRELRNAVERAAIVWPADSLPPTAFPERIAATQATATALGGPFTVEQIEREHILRVMSAASSLDEAARILGIDVSTLWRKRKRFEGS